MMAFLVIVVIILIANQISRATSTNARVVRNEEILVKMDLAIESVLLQVQEDLRQDAEAAAAGGEGGGGADPLGAIAGGGAAGAGAADGSGGGESAPASDSREDEWARPQRTEVGEVRLRIFVQDEDSKFNVLSILTEDEDEAEKAFDRLVRVLDRARGDTEYDLDGGESRRLATTIRETLEARRDTWLERPTLLTDDEDNEERSLLSSLRELVGLAEFTEDHFRDFRDERGTVVHSLESFLTVWSSMTTLDELGSESSRANAGGTPAAAAQEDDPDADSDDDADEEEPGEGEDPAATDAGGAGGGGGGSGIEAVSGAVNVNTAPPAVLKSLFDDRDVDPRFWDEVIEFRNMEDEEVEENEDPPLDEYGEEITVKQFFDTTDELTEIDGWGDLEPILQGEIQQLTTAQSSVFSIYVTARKPTGLEADAPPPSDRRELVERETNGTGLVRTVRQVIWRYAGPGGEVTIVPIVRWEVLDYVPFEVLDFPDEER